MPVTIDVPDRPSRRTLTRSPTRTTCAGFTRSSPTRPGPRRSPARRGCASCRNAPPTATCRSAAGRGPASVSASAIAALPEHAHPPRGRRDPRRVRSPSSAAATRARSPASRFCDSLNLAVDRLHRHAESRRSRAPCASRRSPASENRHGVGTRALEAVDHRVDHASRPAASSTSSSVPCTCTTAVVPRRHHRRRARVPRRRDVRMRTVEDRDRLALRERPPVRIGARDMTDQHRRLRAADGRCETCGSGAAGVTSVANG